MKRREFLTNVPLIGLSAATLGATIVQGCETSPTASGGDVQNDLAFVRESATMEAVSVKTYEAAASSGLLSQINRDAVNRFKSHHESHLGDLNKILRDFGQAEVNLATASPDARLSRITATSVENDVIKLAMELELEAGKLYFRWNTSNIAEPVVQKFFANTYPIEVSHFIVLKSILTGNAASAITPSFEGLSLSLE
jgi:hypothetical protein